MATPSYPALRAEPEPDSAHRNPFQRDRDRIVHSKAFRRLKHKTQVFISPEGDHYRTRLTHTLEACGIARNVARALDLNEDLTEAIGLGHDLGHPPFGHIGEAVLDECVRERYGQGFRHNQHSLRVVERIERLNLTEQVRDGILRHTGDEQPASLEGRIVRVVDRIAYINHDIDDALRAGILGYGDLPSAEIELLGADGSERIETLVVDLLERSRETGDIVQGEEVGGAMLRLREFLFERVYLAADAQREKPRIERMLRALFDHYAANPPPALVEGASERDRVVDWLAGMTDRFAVRTFADLSLPQGLYAVALYKRESIERVRDAVDMVALVGTKSDLRRVGTRWVGLCPFHDERTASFSVNAQDKLFYCFGCQASGDAIGFVQQTEALDFRESVEFLAERYGVELELEREDPREEERRRRREKLLGLLERAARFYSTYLWESEEASRARAYLAEREFSEEVLREFRVGYSPSAWDRVSLSARRDGATPEELMAAGLAQSGRGGGGIYDRFRGRIMFPLADARGRVLGFGARAMGEGRGPKYLNTSENELYHKGRQLFGLDLARSHAAKAGRVIVVEGYTDVLALHQAGVREAVAIMGTALTQEQLAELGRTAPRVLLALDADRSGQEAMLRAARAAEDRGVELRVVPLPEGQDPAELVAKDGADAIFSRVERSQSVLEFQVGRVLADADLDTPEGRDRAFEEARPLVAATPDQTAMRDELVRRLADRLDLSVDYVTTQLSAPPRASTSATAARGSAGPRFAAGAASPPPALTSPGAASVTAERAFLAMCLAGGDLGREYLGRLREGHMSSEVGRRAAEHLLASFEDPLAGLPEDDPAVAALVTGASMEAAEQEAAPEPVLRMSFLQLELRRVDRELRRASQDGDLGRQDKLAGARQEVRSELDSVMGQTA